MRGDGRASRSASSLKKTRQRSGVGGGSGIGGKVGSHRPPAAAAVGEIFDGDGRDSPSSGDRDQTVEIVRCSSDGRGAHDQRRPVARLSQDVLDLVEEAAVLVLVARGGSNFCAGSVAASCSSSFRCSLRQLLRRDRLRRSRAGRRVPRPDTSGMPLPRRRNVGAGLRCPREPSRVSSPSMPGTLISPPSASVVKASGTAQCRSLPSRWKNSCSCT